MIFGIWWGFWILGVAAFFCLARAIYCMWQATKPITDDEKWAPAFNKAWDDSLKKLADRQE